MDRRGEEQKHRLCVASAERSKRRTLPKALRKENLSPKLLSSMSRSAHSDVRKLREFNIHIPFTKEMLKDIIEQKYKPRRKKQGAKNKGGVVILKPLLY